MMWKNKTLNRKGFVAAILLGTGFVLLSILLSSFLGSADLGWSTTVRVLKLKLFGILNPEIGNNETTIIWNLRIPRAILAVFIGGGLAIAGCAMQATTQNILAEPYMLGVSAGALAAVTFGYFLNLPWMSTQAGVGATAFLGAALSMSLVYQLSGVGKKSNNTRLILCGMAISLLFGALSNFFIIATPDSNTVRAVLSWMMGSLSGGRWNNLLIPVIAIGAMSIWFFLKARDFDMISLGDETALSLGTDVKRLKKVSVVIVSLIAGVSVASCGLIGLVGFIVPHSIRLLLDGKHIRLFPLCFVYGGLYLLWMDIFARVILSPSELPIGIMTALCGAPFFTWVLVRKKG